MSSANICKTIARYWLARGYVVNVRAELVVGTHDRHAGHVERIVSDLGTNALPRTPRLAALASGHGRDV